jgi:hypothetical protein
VRDSVQMCESRIEPMEPIEPGESEERHRRIERDVFSKKLSPFASVSVRSIRISKLLVSELRGP